MKLSETVKNIIKNHALESYPDECCGFVVDYRAENKALRCKNFSQFPKKHFSISPKDYLKISKSYQIKAIYHSHPEGEESFSPYDLINSNGHLLNYIMYNVKNDNFTFYDPRKNKTFIDYSEFKIGVSDCYTFVQKYYKRIGINLKDSDYSRSDDWHQEKPNLSEEIAALNKDVKKIPVSSEFKKYDILLFEMLKGKTANHVGIYLGNNTIIHRPRNKFVTIEALSERRKNKISTIYRHEQFI